MALQDNAANETQARAHFGFLFTALPCIWHDDDGQQLLLLLVVVIVVGRSFFFFLSFFLPLLLLLFLLYFCFCFFGFSSIFLFLFIIILRIIAVIQSHRFLVPSFIEFNCTLNQCHLASFT